MEENDESRVVLALHTSNTLLTSPTIMSYKQHSELTSDLFNF